MGDLDCGDCDCGDCDCDCGNCDCDCGDCDCDCGHCCDCPDCRNCCNIFTCFTCANCCGDCAEICLEHPCDCCTGETHRRTYEARGSGVHHQCNQQIRRQQQQPIMSPTADRFQESGYPEGPPPSYGDVVLSQPTNNAANGSAIISQPTASFTVDPPISQI